MRFRVSAGLAAAVVPALIFLAVLGVGVPVSAQTQQSQTNTQPQSQPIRPVPSSQVKTYLHPVRKFVLAIPLGADLSERGKAVQVSIRSRRGYIINIQTGDTNPGLSLTQMLFKLEAQ